MSISLKSFDKTVGIRAEVFVPEKYGDLHKLDPKGRYIARGAGLSYCAASMGEKVTSVDMSYFNRILAFDAQLGKITVEGGICIGDLNNFLLSHRWMLPVLPGYPSITVGGCVGFNVHGKAQYKQGLFGDWVIGLNIYHPSFGMLYCSEKENAELFHLSVGGMGFTGIIISVELRLLPIKGNRILIETLFTGSLEESAEMMIQASAEHDYLYSWNDANLKGSSFGRGVLYRENIQEGFGAGAPTSYKNKIQKTPPFGNLHNRLSVGLMDRLYYAAAKLGHGSKSIPLHKAAFPIYGKEIYYRFFGKKGFREYQVIFPFTTWKPAFEAIQENLQNSGIPVPLCSLKVFRGKSHNLSFAGEGVCLTIDVLNNTRSLAFFEFLDAVSIQYEGVINLSKDSRVSSETVKALFKEYDSFSSRLNEFDPNKIFTSELRERIGV